MCDRDRPRVRDRPARPLLARAQPTPAPHTPRARPTRPPFIPRARNRPARPLLARAQPTDPPAPHTPRTRPTRPPARPLIARDARHADLDRMIDARAEELALDKDDGLHAGRVTVQRLHAVQRFQAPDLTCGSGAQPAVQRFSDPACRALGCIESKEPTLTVPSYEALNRRLGFMLETARLYTLAVCPASVPLSSCVCRSRICCVSRTDALRVSAGGWDGALCRPAGSTAGVR